MDPSLVAWLTHPRPAERQGKLSEQPGFVSYSALLATLSTTAGELQLLVELYRNMDHCLKNEAVAAKIIELVVHHNIAPATAKASCLFQLHNMPGMYPEKKKKLKTLLGPILGAFPCELKPMIVGMVGSLAQDPADFYIYLLHEVGFAIKTAIDHTVAFYGVGAFMIYAERIALQFTNNIDMSWFINELLMCTPSVDSSSSSSFVAPRIIAAIERLISEEMFSKESSNVDTLARLIIDGRFLPQVEALVKLEKYRTLIPKGVLQWILWGSQVEAPPELLAFLAKWKPFASPFKLGLGHDAKTIARNRAFLVEHDLFTLVSGVL